MIRRLLSLVGLLTLAACSRPGPVPAPPPTRPIVFSIVSTEDRRAQMEAWGPFLRDMERSTGLPVHPAFARSDAAAIDSMRFRQSDLGWFSNNAGLKAVQQANGEVFAQVSRASAPGGDQSVIVVRRGGGITLAQLLACNRRLSFGTGGPKSTAGTLAPLTYLFAPRGLDPARCFRTVRTASAEGNLYAVGAGVLDAAADSAETMALMAAHDTPFARRTLSNLQVIWRSPTLPEDPVIWRKDLDPSVKAKLRSFFFSYGLGDTPEAARQKRVLKRLGLGPFQPADDGHLIPVREMQATETLVAARLAGDAAGVQRAQAELAEIAKEKAAQTTPAQPA